MTTFVCRRWFQFCSRQYNRTSNKLYKETLRSVSTKPSIPHVCIVGSGPAGFYTAQQLLKHHKTVHVDIYDKLPVPFGLVRFGVAPDHPEVKNCINQFTKTAKNDRFAFIGNVTVGKDITVKKLKKSYDAIIMCYGADDDRILGIPGENLHGVLSARSFVGWYNGLPEDRNLDVNLNCDTAVVIGHGNVAIDVCRILLTPVSILKRTDITQHSLEVLENSQIKRVYMVGRRGPLQVAFTIKEIREMTKLPGCRSVLDPHLFKNLSEQVSGLPRPRKRLTELMIKTALDTPSEAEVDAEWRVKFLRSPIEIIPSNDGKQVAGIKLRVNRLEGTGESAKAIPTDEVEEIPCGMVLRSIGYKSIPIDDSVPFDNNQGIIPNIGGRVTGMKGIYCSGWVRRGPTGVILSTMSDGFEIGKLVADDLNSADIDISNETVKGKDKVLDDLDKDGVVPVMFADWERIDELEKTRGVSIGKPREKFTTVEDMLEAAFD
ncbi:NADPH:adrenodoxin oxidoreductase, mitochondrial-like [Saccoglossus kowalevskii]|uniref:NADPH:adrenodoxin oxidoreductase, mitochondrial n=1 Tax=Saccoglossus kowalevskii TaxID=10224 RepID=A0ABM0GJ26_SACKO|nr:PREDICTED: NADPH:adrenodoxin oxidoreductase, mitochondrial-like [Saccoglossus kowalevskii]